MPKMRPKDLTPRYVASVLMNAIENDHTGISTADLILTSTGDDGSFTITLAYARGNDVMKRLIVTVKEEA